MSNAATDYSNLEFTSNAANEARFADLPRKRLGDLAGKRILDLGCGDGCQLIAWAASGSSATWVGLDISRQNIELACKRAEASRVAAMTKFEVADLLTYDEQPFDFIFSNSVLHLILSTDEALAGKLASLLKPGGQLAAVIPDSSFPNHLLWLGRRALRMLRPFGIEAFALWAGKRLHPQASEAFLSERLPYLFITPYRYDGSKMRRHMSQAGLTVIQDKILPNDSIAKARHRLVIYRRD